MNVSAFSVFPFSLLPLKHDTQVSMTKEHMEDGNCMPSTKYLKHGLIFGMKRSGEVAGKYDYFLIVGYISSGGLQSSIFHAFFYPS